MMNRKRDDLECEDNGIGPIIKKIKSPPSPFDQSRLNNNNDNSVLLNNKQSTYVLDTDTMTQNDHSKLTIISNLPLQVLKIIFEKKKIFF
jgi:hypothetical protein